MLEKKESQEIFTRIAPKVSDFSEFLNKAFQNRYFKHFPVQQSQCEYFGMSFSIMYVLYQYHPSFRVGSIMLIMK